MTLFNTSVPPPESPPIILHTLSREAIGVPVAAGMGGVVAAPQGQSWPTANLAIFVPFVLPQEVTIRQLFVMNGATVAGNFDIGVYDDAGSLRVSTGSVAMSGSLALQAIAVAPVVLPAGRYYLALANSTAGGGGQHQAINVGLVINGRVMGVCEMAAALPLPGTVTLAGLSSTAYVPIIGLSLRASPAP